MPAWWPRKSSKNKQQQQKAVKDQQNPLTANLNPSKSPIKTICNTKSKDKPKSFDGVLSRNSPRASKDFGPGGSSSGFSGFDSDSHPLPRPSISSGPDQNQPGVVGLGSGSGSVSSVSSCGSSEDHPVAQDQGHFGNHRLVWFGFSLFFFFFFGFNQFYTFESLID